MKWQTILHISYRIWSTSKKSLWLSQMCLTWGWSIENTTIGVKTTAFTCITVNGSRSPKHQKNFTDLTILAVKLCISYTMHQRNYFLCTTHLACWLDNKCLLVNHAIGKRCIYVVYVRHSNRGNQVRTRGVHVISVDIRKEAVCNIM